MRLLNALYLACSGIAVGALCILGQCVLFELSFPFSSSALQPLSPRLHAAATMAVVGQMACGRRPYVTCIRGKQRFLRL